MRILVASKFWYVRGGLERVMFDEIDLLEAAGHEVVAFSTAHPENLPSPYEADFAPYLEIGGASTLGMTDKLRAVARLFRNRAAAKAVGRLIEGTRPDVMHVHGIHRQLSPSILMEAKRRGVPVVHTLHDFHLICPSDMLLCCGTSPCDPPACRGGAFMPAIRKKCVKGSTGRSMLSAAELSFQRVTRAYERSVDRFISPSAFLADTMRANGWGHIPIDVLPQAARPMPQTRGGDAFLFTGRLSHEKGVSTLLWAARKAGVRVVVAGDGPEGEALRAEFPEFTFLGHVSSDRIAELLLDARAAVVPSIGMENSPIAVLEPLAAGVPVIGSRVGGLPELVRDGIDGLLVPPGDIGALAEALTTLANDPEAAARMGAAGRIRVSTEFTPATHLERLLAIYRRALGETNEEAA
jgi:glycosyltransferase involved in cell wall biosynthesis